MVVLALMLVLVKAVKTMAKIMARLVAITKVLQMISQEESFRQAVIMAKLSQAVIIIDQALIVVMTATDQVEMPINEEETTHQVLIEENQDSVIIDQAEIIQVVQSSLMTSTHHPGIPATFHQMFTR